jgi:hypothetical protein
VNKIFNGIKISIPGSPLPKFFSLYTKGPIIPTFALPKEQTERATTIGRDTRRMFDNEHSAGTYVIGGRF